MSDHMEYDEESIEEATLVKYSNPILVIKNPDKPTTSASAKVYIFYLNGVKQTKFFVSLKLESEPRP